MRWLAGIAIGVAVVAFASGCGSSSTEAATTARVTIGHAIYVLGGDGTNAVLRILTR